MINIFIQSIKMVCSSYENSNNEERLSLETLALQQDFLEASDVGNSSELEVITYEDVISILGGTNSENLNPESSLPVSNNEPFLSEVASSDFTLQEQFQFDVNDKKQKYQDEKSSIMQSEAKKLRFENDCSISVNNINTENNGLNSNPGTSYENLEENKKFKTLTMEEYNKIISQYEKGNVRANYKDIVEMILTTKLEPTSEYYYQDLYDTFYQRKSTKQTNSIYNIDAFTVENNKKILSFFEFYLLKSINLIVLNEINKDNDRNIIEELYVINKYIEIINRSIDFMIFYENLKLLLNEIKVERYNIQSFMDIIIKDLRNINFPIKNFTRIDWIKGFLDLFKTNKIKNETLLWVRKIISNSKLINVYFFYNIEDVLKTNKKEAIDNLKLISVIRVIYIFKDFKNFYYKKNLVIRNFFNKVKEIFEKE
ncbi:hypothetical protein HERIO_1756 [Hepatospora eriocheir]|uniref:Uncharacterized protein n=1 Tax=Hepatospora eriocheir TaxID=1081669 RepID=A0A1X0Q974_9MICR|nr:hypothetical protein HERIO_1756 [Hepatospora eriocheir]